MLDPNLNFSIKNLKKNIKKKSEKKIFQTHLLKYNKVSHIFNKDISKVYTFFSLLLCKSGTTPVSGTHVLQFPFGPNKATL